MATTPTPKTEKEALVLALLESPLLSHTPLAADLYPNDKRTSASAKFSAKRQLQRYQRFSEAEQDAIIAAVQKHIKPVLDKLAQLTGEPTPTA